MNKTLVLCIVSITLACRLTAVALDRINVTDYGATPNDGTNDTVAINSALAAGTSIYFPPGSYNYTGRITLPASKSYRIYGDGPNVSIILFTGPTAGIYAPTLNASSLNVDGITLQALTAAAGTAISATFNPGFVAKFRTATIHNVEIRGTDRTGSSVYWTTGIYLFKAPNSVIDKVEIDGTNPLTATGINWTTTSTAPTTGLFVTNTEIKFCNTAITTSGWVEGFYMSNFEIVLCGASGKPALDLQSSQATLQSPAFTLVNGHIDFIGDGVKMVNLSAIKVANVDFQHTSSAATDGTFLSITNCIAAIVVDNTFTSQQNYIANENGVFLTSTDQARISGNIFRSLFPTVSGSPIVAYTGSKTVRISENIFKTCRNSFDNYIGSQAYYDTDNVIVP